MSGLENAPKHIQLAVDLIMLLEQNEIDNQTALMAIKLVEADLQEKIKNPVAE